MKLKLEEREAELYKCENDYLHNNTQRTEITRKLLLTDYANHKKLLEIIKLC